MIPYPETSIFAGTSGLILPVKNKLFYPEEYKEKSRLYYYGSLMNSIEINSSFYKVPMASTVQKWADEVPEGFKFTFKLFKEITHSNELLFNEEQVGHFMSVIDRVGDKQGCLLVQFPPRIRIKDYGQFNRLAACLRFYDADSKWNIAFEFRHPSWYCEELYELLEEYKMGLVLHDKAPANTPMLDNNASFAYLRFHGPGGNYRGSYTPDVLSEYASYIKEWQLEGKRIFVYFNNTIGNVMENLRMLVDMVAEM